MARIELAPEVFDDFERFFEHLARFDAADIPARIQRILGALQVLEDNPLIGRPVRERKRELLIGQGARGYVALYRYLAEIDTVFVLAIRAQREAGFKH